MTKIEWVKNQDGTQGRSWNPITGCTKISPGCKNCYAERMARRQVAMGLARHERGSDNNDTWIAYSNAIDPDTGRWSGEIACRHKELDAPLHWKKPRTIFACSMSDWLHPDVPFSFAAKMFAVASATRQHTYQFLTKRAERLPAFFRWATESAGASFEWPLPNVWLGVSVENQAAADERIPLLLQTPAAVRFVSAEPLLSEIGLCDVSKIGDTLYHCQVCSGNGIDPGAPSGITRGATCPECSGIQPLDWVIVGGESGPGARPMDLDWARNIRDQCRMAGVPFFMKQMSKRNPIPEDLMIREFPNV